MEVLHTKILNCDRSADPDQGICAGKNSVAEYLVNHHAFTRVYVAQPLPSMKRDQSAECSGASLGTPVFDDAYSLLEHVTKTWQQRWVTTDVWKENLLESFLRRPFFLLISIDAPVSLRWKRLQDKLIARKSFKSLS